MAAPTENDPSMMLMTAFVLARSSLSQFRSGSGSAKDPAVRKQAGALIDALGKAVPLLALAVARSVGCEAPKPPVA